MTLEQEMDARYGKRTGSREMRPRRKPNYNHKLLAQTEEPVVAPSFNTACLASLDSSLEPLLQVILTQYGVRKGLKIFGKSGDDAVMAEVQQLHHREVLHPKSGPTLSKGDRAAALNYLMFLKKKRDGTIKGRGCADGRKQPGNIQKIEASSPTISTEAVLLIAAIAAKENRDVATMDVPGAFLQTDLEGEKMQIKLEGRMAELLAIIDPKLYRQHIIMENGRPVLYAELRKALYGMLQSALLFWQQITSDLTKLAYVVNEYDWCVMNKVIDGEQHTVGWHVDDFLMTHKNPKVNDGLIEWFNQKYGKLSPVTVRRGKVHDYLGMTLDFSTDSKFKVIMVEYVDRMINEAPDEFGVMASTPASKHLLMVECHSPKL